MENFDQIESDILNKIKNVSIETPSIQLKLKFLVKRELLRSFLKKLEAWIKVREKNMLQNLMILKQK